MLNSVNAVAFENDKLIIIDQTLLPTEEKYIILDSIQDVYETIRALKVRGAPAIGIVAAYGMYAGLRRTAADNISDFLAEFISAKNFLASSRPTAVNLFTALNRQERRLLGSLTESGYRFLPDLSIDRQKEGSLEPDVSQDKMNIHSLKSCKSLDRMNDDSFKPELSLNSVNIGSLEPDASGNRVNVRFLLSVLLEEANRIKHEEEAASLAMGEYGLSLLKPGMGILTHCNAGALAAAGYGTALSPVYLGHERGYGFKVFADETRPLLQGARLTTWELMKSGIDVTLICDNMASAAIKNGWVQAILTGSDRMAANGDGANKIGTSALAILAKAYGIPFYMFAPTSTIDLDTDSGEHIPIELREGEEISELWFEKPVAPRGVKTWNPAFDITEHEYITAIITENGVIYPPFKENLIKTLNK